MHQRPTVTCLLWIIVLAGGIGRPSTVSAEESPTAKPVSRLLFGSCVREQDPAPIFQSIVAQRPELFVFLGDNIYADTTDMDEMRAKYAKLRADAGFSKLLETCPVLATWDDHDYGANDAGADYPRRVESQRIFVDFWGDADDSPRRRRPGVYDARVFGPPGRRLQIILLDTRYFRSPLKTGPRRVGGPYLPDDDSQLTMLGQDQWEWLEEQLRQPAELRIIATSVQCLAEASGQETWSNMPRERKRLFQLIAETEADGVVLISGDRHWAELSLEDQATPYPLYDLTSSSFNQLHARGTPTDNEFRALPKTYHRENFGAITIDWERDDPEIRLEIRDIQGNTQLAHALPLSQLRARPPLQSVDCAGSYQHHLQGITTDGDPSLYWSFTTQLVKTDSRGVVLRQIPVANHHGDLCHHDGKLYVAVNLGPFNDPQGRADSWVYVYDADNLSLLAKHHTPELVYGAGGMDQRHGHFYVIGGLPPGINENYVYEYDADLVFIRKHVIASGYTLMGIQTAAFADGHWYFGCYGNPRVLLKTDAAFKMVGRYEIDCALGIVGLTNGRLLIAEGPRTADGRHQGRAISADPDDQRGLVVSP